MAQSVLEYATRDTEHRHRRRWWLAFVIGAAIGYAVALMLLAILRAGGPIFPMTVLFAPVAVFVEWFPRDPTSLELELEAGGPLLYGLYAALFVSRNRRHNLCIAAVVHALCFAITLWQRDVL